MTDDCSVYPRTELDQRRHLCCTQVLGKLLGAAAQAGADLPTLRALAAKVMDNVASLSVAYRGASNPVTGQPMSSIPEGEMIIGMGHHGEGAKGSMPMATSKQTVEIMAGKIFEDIGLQQSDEVVVTINGSGSMTFMEMLIVYKDTVRFLEGKGVKVIGKIVGEYLTTQEQAGFSMSVLRVDEELKGYYQAPCRTANRIID